MAKPISFPPNTRERMQDFMKRCKTASELKRVQCVLFGAIGTSSLNIAPLVDYTPAHVRYIWQKYREKGDKALLGENRGQVRGRALLSWEEERQFLSPFLEKGERGGILIISEIHRAYEKKYGKKAHKSIIYSMMHRHGWRKIAPRPSHPKGDPKVREEYKALIFPPDNIPSKD